MPAPKKYTSDAKHCAVKAASSRQRRANKTPEQKQIRVEKQCHCQKRKCAAETTEE